MFNQRELVRYGNRIGTALREVRDLSLDVIGGSRTYFGEVMGQYRYPVSSGNTTQYVDEAFFVMMHQPQRKIVTVQHPRFAIYDAAWTKEREISDYWMPLFSENDDPVTLILEAAEYKYNNLPCNLFLAHSGGKPKHSVYGLFMFIVDAMLTNDGGETMSALDDLMNSDITSSATCLYRDMQQRSKEIISFFSPLKQTVTRTKPEWEGFSLTKDIFVGQIYSTPTLPVLRNIGQLRYDLSVIHGIIPDGDIDSMSIGMRESNYAKIPEAVRYLVPTSINISLDSISCKYGDPVRDDYGLHTTFRNSSSLADRFRISYARANILDGLAVDECCGEMLSFLDAYRKQCEQSQIVRKFVGEFLRDAMKDVVLYGSI